MKKSGALLLVVLVAAGGCRVSSNEMAGSPGSAGPPSSPGRWQVIQTENNQRAEKQPILLDTATGETWVQSWDANKGYIWKRAERRE